jgi:tight adherence protein C
MDGPDPAERLVTAVPLAAGGAAALAIALAAAPHRPRPARLVRPAASPRRAPRQATPRRAVGAPVIAGVVATAALLVAPPLAVLVIAGTAARARHVAARTRHRVERAVTTVLPDVVDLLALATGAGVALPIAHPLVAARVPGPVGEALHAAAVAAGAGEARADALVRALTPLGDGARRLADVLADHLRYGLPLGPGLDRLGAELRLHRRRRAEQAARRVPVRLLGPLVACVLPAFALLTVVPLLAASLRALPA